MVSGTQKYGTIFAELTRAALFNRQLSDSVHMKLAQVKLYVMTRACSMQRQVFPALELQIANVRVILCSSRRPFRFEGCEYATRRCFW